MARLLGVGSPAMLIGRSIRKSCVFPEHAETILSPPSDGAALEICLRNAVGEDVWALASSMEAEEEQGAPAVIEATLTDVTRQRHYERELRHARSAAEEANRAKGDFLANMSHEIRTPLNGVLGMTQLALDGDLPREEREYLKLAKLSAESLLTVIDDILDFSKIEAGKIDMEVIAFDPREAFAAALKTLAARASAKKIELILDVDDAVPESIQADPTRLRQVILNLVGNAIKFTEQGEVVLRITTERQGRRATLLFEVSDTGVGIPVEKHKTIFESFSQADGSTTRKYGGTGLGLAICSRLVRLMHGEIKIESEPMLGSRFYFSIPLRAAEPPAVETYPKSELGGRSALIVDDHARSREVLARILARAGMHVEAAGDATEAIEKLRSATARAEPFDLLLADSNMPNLDGGLALIETVANDAAVRSLPALLLSPASERKRSASGANINLAACLGKPVSRDELFEAVARALIPEGEAQETSEVAPVNGRDEIRPMHVLLAEDNVVNRALVTRLLLRAGCSVEAAVNGKEAVDAATRQEFDLLLMDVQMPKMDGLEATRLIRKAESGRHMPILALTAHAMKGDEERCLEAGMDAYLSKPVDPGKLFEAIERLAGPRLENPDLTPAAPSKGVKEPGVKPGRIAR